MLQNKIVSIKEYNVKKDIMDYIDGLETENTKKRYLANIKKFIEWKWKKPMEFLVVDDINSINYTDMKKFRDSMRRKYSAGTVNNILTTVYSLLKELKKVQEKGTREYVYDIDDIERLRVKQFKNKNVKHAGYLTWEETDEWIEFLNGSEESNKEKKILFLKLSRQTALRKEALVNFKYSDVRQEDGVYVIHSFLKQRKHKVAIPDELAEEIFNSMRIGDTKDSKVLGMSGKTCERLLDMLKEEFEIEDERNITLHSLRNLSAWEVYCLTGDLLAVQDHLGHEDISTTYQYIKDRKSTESAPSLYIGQELDEDIVKDVNSDDWCRIFEQLPRNVKYEIVNKVKELGYSQE